VAATLPNMPHSVLESAAASPLSERLQPREKGDGPSRYFHKDGTPY